MVAKGGSAMEKESRMERNTTQCVDIRFAFRLNELDSMYAENRRAIESLTFSGDESPETLEKEYADAIEAQQTERKTVLAVKNNLLYDLALAPNLEIELPIGKRWSLNTEYKCPWWVNSSRDFCYQLLSGGAEARYWLGKRCDDNRLIGHFVGLYAEGGIYDFQFGGDGYQGKYYGTSGLTYGYVKPITRHLALEFSFGVGYLTTEYRKYTPYKEDLIWTNSGRYNFIGPTKAKVSLVWLITTRR